MVYDPHKFVKSEEIVISKELEELLKKASIVYKENFSPKTWYGRCIFISWWCATPTCKFCYRSTAKHQLKHREDARRSIGSILIEALFCKVFNWRIEFLTGGCNCLPPKDLEHIAKLVSKVYGERIWVNLGVIPKKERETLEPYVKGICASIETPVPHIHTDMCPQKPIEPYLHMFSSAQNFKKSAALIIGLGDTKEDLNTWNDFIKSQDLSRITVYALKPIKGGPIEDGPDTETYIWWLAQLRIANPTLEIIGGTNLRRAEEVGYMMRAGVNAITKFPATKEFGTPLANKIKALIENEGREFISNIVSAKGIDFEKEIENVDIEEEYKDAIREVLPLYLEKIKV